MSRQRSRNTQIEILIRKKLHHAGLRFRVHRRPIPDLNREADIVFGPARVAVFVDGCYWHGCPEHATWPKTNADFWREKITRNRERDQDTDRKLTDAGWMPVRVWEHEDPAEAVKTIVAVVRERRELFKA
ncbi:very short patch repair endonuclease [Planomonospora venezuelensis]|uniref:DNA mismatch endonuclease (Patch repair protein) n=1 Tax=Planomonospora venezuelensis TaxID=1999 RepID=A0A841DB86_PLAVE|nr:very short patch repair endonuclease [Planomonospora venezuelensis]MBB5965375.1 DNA mismatch endonuclease (patch repair protein) [Planomonospora venezuelensis]GIN05143.1 very short patch repair endonuclease [Planomonospora venezuelensis]